MPKVNAWVSLEIVADEEQGEDFDSIDVPGELFEVKIVNEVDFDDVFAALNQAISSNIGALYMGHESPETVALSLSLTMKKV